MNILMCSVGRRVKLVQYFKGELHKIGGKVIAVDCEGTAPALHHADYFEVVPRITHPDYIQCIKDLCIKYEIKGVLSLIDPELSLLSSYKKYFEKDNITIIVSNKEVVDICYDKYLTYQLLMGSGIPCVKTYLDMNKVKEYIATGTLQFPLIVKPRFGSASIGLHKVNNMKELEFFLSCKEELIVQPFIKGEEYGVDCYIDLVSEDSTNIFMKRKISMRAGETDKSIAVKEPELKSLIQKLIHVLKPLGPIDVDCFKTKDGYIISEINPRFGGGYLHAHEMGQNFVKNIINNLMGNINSINGDDYQEGTTLVKYDHFIIINSGEVRNTTVDNELTLQIR